MVASSSDASLFSVSATLPSLHPNPCRTVVLLCCRYCQALFTPFSFLSSFFEEPFSIGRTCIAHLSQGTHMRRHHYHCEAAEIRDRPCPHPGLNTRSSRSHGLNPLRWRLPLALRLEVSNELLSVRACAPVTRYFMRLSTPAGRPEEATPSIQRLAAQALHYHGLPPPASSARRDPVGRKRLPHFEGRSFR